jgi:hypothetical protein
VGAEALALVRRAVAREEALHELRGLAHGDERPLDRHLDPVEHRPRAEAEDRAAARELVERRDTRGRLDRMAQVRVGDVRPDEHALGVLGDQRQDRPHGPPPDDVVHRQLVEGERLDRPRQLDVAAHREGAVQLHAELRHPARSFSCSSPTESPASPRLSSVRPVRA